MPYNNTDVGARRPQMQSRLRVPQVVRSCESLDQPGGFAAREVPVKMESRTLFFGDGGRKHYEPTRSDTESWHPGRRTLNPNHSGYQKVGGLKRIPHPVPYAAPRAEQRLEKDDRIVWGGAYFLLL